MSTKPAAAHPHEFSVELNSDGTMAFEPAPILEKFRSKGILDNTETTLPFPLPWYLQIATQAAAQWACNTAADVVSTIIKVVPDDQTKLNLTQTYKFFIRIT